MPRQDNISATAQSPAQEAGRAKPVVLKQKAKSRYKIKANGKNNVGWTSTYNAKCADMAFVLMSEHGLTEAELAKALTVSVPTLTKWKKEHSEMLLAIRDGKDQFDVAKVQEALRSRALGYKYMEKSTKSTTITLGRGDNKITTPAEEVTVHEKSLAPDVTACIFWLVNRQPGKWQHLARTIVQGDPKKPVEHKHEYQLDLSQLPEEDLNKLERIITKARGEQQASKAGVGSNGPSGTA
jgi:transcriptional regulator with XRE-family HTH domain